MKLLSIVAARPNFVKLAAVHHAIVEEGGIEHVIVHTGQHYDPILSDVFFEQLKIPMPDHNLGVHGTEREEVIGRTEKALLPVLQKEKPDCVLVYGDVNGGVGAAQAAKKSGIKLAHVEAGLRSGDMAMPEEHNRIRIDELADFLFCTEQSGMEHLASEGVKGEAFLVGNTMIDTLMRTALATVKLEDVIQGNLPRLFEYLGGKYSIATIHRPSNVDDPAILERVIFFLSEVAKNCPIILPAHPRLRKALERNGYRDDGRGPLWIVDTMDYFKFISFMRAAVIIITDSGGIQEEATYLKKKCFTLRRNTERPATIESGSNTLIDESKESDRQLVLDYAKNPVPPTVTIPEMWDGKAGKRIVDTLQKVL